MIRKKGFYVVIWKKSDQKDIAYYGGDNWSEPWEIIGTGEELFKDEHFSFISSVPIELNDYIPSALA